MAIDIQQEQKGAVRIISLSGRLDTETASDLELAMQDLLAANEAHFVIDLTGISYVSSAGLRVLLALAKQLDGGRGSLRLCGLNASVTDVFDVAGFSKLFAIYPNRAAALAGHPQGKIDPALAKNAASLIGAAESASPPDKSTADLARSAAKILGAEHAPPAPPKVTPKPSARPGTAARPAASVPTKSPQASEGPLQKLRNLFGGKR